MQIETITDVNGVDHVVCTNEDGSFTCTPKSIYDELKANDAMQVDGDQLQRLSGL